MTTRDLLQDLGIETIEAGQHHHARAGWLQIDCPFCGPDTQKFHLGFNLHFRYWNCWKCGNHWARDVWERLGASKAQIAAVTEDDFDLTSIKEKKRAGLREPKGRGPLLPIHREYLRSRGFNPQQMVHLWGIEGIGLATRLAWRLYIPIVHRGARVSWTTRAIGDKVEQRYISASADEESISHKHCVYGLDLCQHSIVIVEGPIDAWAVGPGAGALFGTGYSTAQVRLLSRVPYRFVCFDADARLRARELASELSCFPGRTIVVELDAEDPGSASRPELARLRKLARI